MREGVEATLESQSQQRAMSENRPTRTYDDECPKHPVFGDCALVDGPLFGGRPNCRLQHLRPDRPHHASGSHQTEPIENADRSKRKGASRYTVLRGRSAATSALDNGDLLIEGLSRNRRLAKDYERQVQTSETLIEIAIIRLLLRRLRRAAS